jgi:hypothetical protein
MDALACENILTRRANQRQHSIIAQFVKPPDGAAHFRCERLRLVN